MLARTVGPEDYLPVVHGPEHKDGRRGRAEARNPTGSRMVVRDEHTLRSLVPSGVAVARAPTHERPGRTRAESPQRTASRRHASGRYQAAAPVRPGTVATPVEWNIYRNACLFFVVLPACAGCLVQCQWQLYCRVHTSFTVTALFFRPCHHRVFFLPGHDLVASRSQRRIHLCISRQ